MKYQMTFQILHYEFLGPIKLSEWGPPMEEVVYLLLTGSKNGWHIIYAGESEKTEEKNFFTKNDKFKCWVQNAGSEKNLSLSIYPMWGSTSEERKRLVDKVVSMYKPVCNSES